MEPMNGTRFLDDPLSRRTLLAGAGLAALLAACGSSDSPATAPATSGGSTTAPGAAAPRATNAPPTVPAAATTVVVPTAPAAPVSATSTLTAADFTGMGTCVLAPEKTAGPFPLDEQFDRSDITEGVAGHPLRLGLRVLDAACAPVTGARVEIWHADATGDYSAFVDNGGGKDDGAGTTFLRGTQAVNADGIAEFLTIYPGWYRGRAVHIHLRVHVDGHVALTSQLFFDEAYTGGVYAAAPYAEFGTPDTTNAADRIAGDVAAEGTMLVTTGAETANGPGSISLHNLAIDPATVSTGDAAGPGGPPPAGPPPAPTTQAVATTVGTPTL